MVSGKSCPSDNEVGVCPPSVRTPSTSEVPQGALSFESLFAPSPEALVSMPLKEEPKARGASEPACFVPGPLSLKPENAYFSIVLLEILTDG